MGRTAAEDKSKARAKQAEKKAERKKMEAKMNAGWANVKLANNQVSWGLI